MSLEVLKPQLLKIPVAELRVPAVPIATALQEAHDLLRFTTEPAIHDALLTVGLPTDFSEQLELRIDAARESQSEWVSERDQNKSSELVEAETQAQEARSRLIAAGRYNLRSSAEAQAALSAIASGDGVADLIQDLHDLAKLVERHAPAFANDRSFDAAEQVAAARDLSRLLSTHVSNERLGQPNDARELRDRAFSYLYELVATTREAGRYIFRLDSDTRKRFGSRYRRRINRRRAKNDSSPEEPPAVEEVVEEELLQE